MSESLKVQPHHVERDAYLYVRQSSMRQVIENVESTKRQYALRGRPIALGWREDQIVVVDISNAPSRSCWSATPAPARVILPPAWLSLPVVNAGECALRQPRRW